MHGIILVDKEQDYTSRDVVNCIGKKFKTKKVGHTGTLDPLATGVLAICVGRATKLVELLQSTTKVYHAFGILGLLTDTLDITGKVKVKSYVNDKWITGDLSVNNIMDIIVFDVPAPETEQLLYLLTDTGDVYWYKFGEADNKNFAVVKVDNISNVQKLFISHFTKENAGGSWALFAITKNGDCVMLKGESV